MPIVTGFALVSMVASLWLLGNPERLTVLNWLLGGSLLVWIAGTGVAITMLVKTARAEKG